MEFTKRYCNGFGKPELPDVTARQHLSLSQFATEDSNMFFQILSIPSAFLAKLATQWEDNEDYALGSEIISGLKVCNHSAERGVKLVADFLHLARVEKTSKITYRWSKRTEGKLLTFENAPLLPAKLYWVVYCTVVKCLYKCTELLYSATFWWLKL